MDPIFPLGSLVRITAAFLTSSGSLSVDPVIIKGQYHAAALGITTTYTYGSNAQLVRGGTGVYYFDIDTAESSGVIFWRVFSTSTGQAADEGRFYVRPRQF